jgi:hypothetical protein
MTGLTFFFTYFTFVEQCLRHVLVVNCRSSLLHVQVKVGSHCNVTAYRNAVSWQCGRDSWPRNVSKFGPLPPNDTYICRTAPLTSRRCI